MSLRKSLALVAAAAVVGMLTFVGTAAADPVMTVSPLSVEVGGTVTVSGTECYDADVSPVPKDPEAWNVNVSVKGAEPKLVFASQGSWTAENLQVPPAPGTYEVTATCSLYERVLFDYPMGSVTVTAPPTTPTTPTSPTTESSTPEPVPPSATIGDVTRAGCQVSIPVTTTGTGPFTLSVWDDSEVVDSVEWNTPSAAEITTLLSWVISEPAREAAPGVGFVVTITDGAGQLAMLDPWEYPASAADACADAGDMSVALIGYTGTVAPGGTIQIEASGFYPDEQVTAVLFSDPVQLATLTADANGTVSGSLVIPADTTIGTHTLVLTGVLSLLSTQIEVVVASASSTSAPVPPATVTPTAPSLAATGIDSTGLSYWGFSLLLAGGVFLAFARRRPVAGEHRSDAD